MDAQRGVGLCSRPAAFVCMNRLGLILCRRMLTDSCTCSHFTIVLPWAGLASFRMHGKCIQYTPRQVCSLMKPARTCLAHTQGRPKRTAKQASLPPPDQDDADAQAPEPDMQMPTVAEPSSKRKTLRGSKVSNGLPSLH